MLKLPCSQINGNVFVSNFQLDNSLSMQMKSNAYIAYQIATALSIPQSIFVVVWRWNSTEEASKHYNI